MSATIRDVAKICGVSVSTVSRVLNGYTDISEETAGKVFRVEAVGNAGHRRNRLGLKFFLYQRRAG